jgi:hypothetical protein
MLLITLYREIVRQRLALYQGVCPVHMEFSDCAEKTFGDACSYLLVITDISYPLRFFYWHQLKWLPFGPSRRNR